MNLIKITICSLSECNLFSRLYYPHTKTDIINIHEPGVWQFPGNGSQLLVTEAHISSNHFPFKSPVTQTAEHPSEEIDCFSFYNLTPIRESPFGMRIAKIIFVLSTPPGGDQITVNPR